MEAERRVAGGPIADLSGVVTRMTTHEHLCLIYESGEERLAGLVPFLTAGLSEGRHCVYLGDADVAATLVDALQAAGVDVPAASASGAFAVLSRRDDIIADAGQIPESIIAYVTRESAAAVADGFSALCVAADMGWLLMGSGPDSLIELESRLHAALPSIDCLALFQYDQTSLPAETIRDVILTHTTVIHGVNVYRNPRAVPPDKFLGRDRTAREVDRLLGVLGDQKALLDETARLARSREVAYQSLVASLHEGVILQEASGRVALFNLAAEHIFGVGADEVIGETSTSYDWKLVTADGTALPGEEHPSMHTLRTGEPCSDVVLGITRPDGERRWVSVSTEPVWDGEDGRRHVSAVAISFVDITERLRAYEERRADAALLRGVMEAMPSGCAVYEVRGDGSRGDDYVIRYFNAVSLAIEGLTLEQVVGKSLADLRPAIDDYGLIPVFQRVWRTGAPAVFPARIYVDEQFANYYENRVFRLPDGEIVAIYDDVTEREATTEALKASEETWRSYVENAPYGVFITDAKGRYLQVNPEACRTTGYSERELLTMSIADVLPPETRELGLEHFSQLLATGKSVGEAPYMIKSGERRWWSVSAVRLSDDRFLGFTADVTDRVRAREQLADVNILLEQRVRERTAELEAANGELEAFNYSVSHDLRAPLRHISGFASLLREEAGDRLSDEQRHCFERIDSAVGKMGQLIDDLIEFSRVGRSDLMLREVDSGSLVVEAIETVRPDAGDREIEWVVGPLPPAFADAPALRLVWVNLLDNAVKYTAPHGRARIEVGGRREDGATVFWVRDDGVGFDPAYADKLFGVFQRLHHDGQFSGTGIGLATVRRVVSRHGGRVRAEGAVEGGATVWFSLPWPRA